jgi:hypothetical protein
VHLTDETVNGGVVEGGDGESAAIRSMFNEA